MSDIKLKIGSGTWEDAKALLGKEIAVVEGADEVTRADVRRRLEVFGFDSPLNTDEEVARAHGYPTTPALTASLLTWSMPAYWSPGDPRPRMDDPLYMPPFPVLDIPAPGSQVFAVEIETEFDEPVYPGDRITSTTVLVDITPKKLSVGDGAFTTVETTHRKQDGSVAAIDRLTLFRFEPADGD